MIYEDALGFIPHHSVMPRDAKDQDVAVPQTRIVQQRLDNRIKELSFDRGFHSPENQKELAEIVPGVCLPKPGAKQAAHQSATESDRFHAAKKRHSGVESAIGALQSGNGLVRCRDVLSIYHSENGFERYVVVAVATTVLGRNIHALGKLLIRRINSKSAAAISYRQAT